MKCIKCGSENVQVVSEMNAKSRGCMMILVHIFLALMTAGIWLILLWLKGRKIQSKTKFVCLNCKNSWV
jgi:hypothetical protein